MGIIKRKIHAEFESVKKITKKSYSHIFIRVKNSTFLYFEVQRGRTAKKKRKNVFCNCVLGLNFATINGLGEPSC